MSAVSRVDSSAICKAPGMTSTAVSHSEPISRSPMGIGPKLSSCWAMTGPRQRIWPRRNRSLPRRRIRLRQVRLRAHAKTKLTIRPPGLEQATMRKEQLDEILDGKRNRNLRRQLRHGRLLLVLRAEADVRCSPRCAGGVSSALAAHTSRRPTRLLQDCDAAFSGRLPEALVDRVPRRVRRWPRAVAAHGTASDHA